IIGPYIIRKLESMQIGEVIRADGPERHHYKAGTPTMGGVIILISMLGSVLLWGNFGNLNVWLVILVTLGMGAIGFVDDYRQVVLKKEQGLTPAVKILSQVVVALVASSILYMSDFDSTITIPFFKGVAINIGPFYILFAVFVIVGTSNAVNLTDGLDGLAIGPMVIAASTYMLLAYITSHIKIAGYLHLMHVASAGELTIFAGSMAGASMGFLWFNTYPAQVFMGDIGALSLGGALGTIALITKHEVLLVLIGGIFVVEALSVIFQVSSFKLRGKRVFQRAPIHHHYELKGWAEPKIIVRFWIIAIILSLVAISTLKIR
ncbi:MAG: phospho-N-acetylmuramoyl-pentapeptide-transferase, partial [Thermodesulfobacteriota bacterium]